MQNKTKQNKKLFTNEEFSPALGKQSHVALFEFKPGLASRASSRTVRTTREALS